MLGVDPESSASLVRLWIAAGSAALALAPWRRVTWEMPLRAL